MGAFSTSVCVRAPLADLVLDGPVAAAEVDGWTVLVAEDVEGIEAAGEWARELTASGATALAVDLHDSDILMISLVAKGQVVGSYDSYPNYFSDDEDRTQPVGLPGSDLVAALGQGNPEQVEAVLRFAADVVDPYLFEEDRHRALLTALGLPATAVAAGWRSVTQKPTAFPDFRVLT